MTDFAAPVTQPRQGHVLDKRKICEVMEHTLYNVSIFLPIFNIVHLNFYDQQKMMALNL